MKDVVNKTKIDGFWLIAMQQNFLNGTDVIIKNVTVTENNEPTIITKVYIKECSLFFSLQFKL